MNRKEQFIYKLKKYSSLLTMQLLKTLRGQAIKGDVEAAEKGLIKLLNRLDKTVL